MINDERIEKTSHVVRLPHNHQQSNQNIVSVAPTTQKVNKKSEDMKDELTAKDHSNNETNEKYAVGDICMIAQTNICLQFHTARIQQMLERNAFSDIFGN